ncbi:rare lipoprotein A [Nitritalea halalkaliphila LW7]|uniref:Probable endolytic peptidoglycan transglycosylase RlpA n=1 Tax=Nitritalea halalkaliphila LW7 TaxID=1189621 RepID=I5BZ49_9BACT|nr:septal ring lytic transglycosylase RlpA family protein [Nitritalea halalkaliphila]EIM74851.1 rare lipoprotein A [Nitritalea halalkaliphila LW7]
MKMKKIALFLFLLCFSPFLRPAAALNDPGTPLPAHAFKIQEGTASFYAKKFHLKKTASGEVYDMHGFTAAHKFLPFGTEVLVLNPANGQQVRVTINDRLPRKSAHSIDLSRAAAEALDMVRDGVISVEIRVPGNREMQFLEALFGEDRPEELRIRVYEQAISIQRPSLINKN